MCSSTLRRPKRPRSPPGTPGPHTTEALSLIRQGAYPPASPASANKIRHFRQQLFSSTPDLRSGTPTSNLDEVTDRPSGSGMGPPMPPPVHNTPNQPSTSASEQDPGNHTDDEQTETSPRRNNRLPRRPAAPDLEDALTRLTQTVNQMVNIQQQPQPAAVINQLNPPEYTNFYWVATRYSVSSSSHGSGGTTHSSRIIRKHPNQHPF